MKNLLIATFVACLLTTVACATNNPALAAASNYGQNIQSCGGSAPCASNRVALAPGEGSPMPVCQPGHNCGQDQLRMIAGEGSPMPVCQPGHNCNDDQEKFVWAS